MCSQHPLTDRKEDTGCKASQGSGWGHLALLVEFQGNLHPVLGTGGRLVEVEGTTGRKVCVAAYECTAEIRLSGGRAWLVATLRHAAPLVPCLLLGCSGPLPLQVSDGARARPLNLHTVPHTTLDQPRGMTIRRGARRDTSSGIVLCAPKWPRPGENRPK